jgi:hypothetical protein
MKLGDLHLILLWLREDVRACPMAGENDMSGLVMAALHLGLLWQVVLASPCRVMPVPAEIAPNHKSAQAGQ